MDMHDATYATGKRKTAIARTWLTPGSGKITVNNQSVDEYFPVETFRLELIKPFNLTDTLGSYDVKARIAGGGISGQAGALRHGITKALILINPSASSWL